MTTVHPDAGIIWFAGLGFRPAVWTPPHRHDEVDPPRLVPSPDSDVAYLGGKYDAPADTPAGHGFGFVLYPDTAAPAQLTAAELAGTIPGPFTAGPLIPGPWPSEPEWPCCVIREPDTPLPPVAPVPVPASASLLIAAVAAFAIIRRRAK